MNTKKRHDIERRLHEAATICAKHGAQFTELRRSVLNLILEADGPLTAYQLLDRLKETRKSAVPPTIYRALDFLIEQGLIHKIERSAFTQTTSPGLIKCDNNVDKLSDILFKSPYVKVTGPFSTATAEGLSTAASSKRVTRSSQIEAAVVS